MDLELLPQPLAVLRLEPDTALPDWLSKCAFFSVTRTDDELSIFCDAAAIPEQEEKVAGWRAFRVVGQLDLELPGIIAQLAVPLAGRQISVFSLSTHDTDYMLVGEAQLADAQAVLTAAGHRFL
jgi:hypothetical protein